MSPNRTRSRRVVLTTALLLGAILTVASPTPTDAARGGARATPNCTVHRDAVSCTAGSVTAGVYRIDGGKWRYYANVGQPAP